MGKPELSELKEQVKDKLTPAIDSDELLAAAKNKNEVEDATKDLYEGREVKGYAEAAAPGESHKERMEHARREVDAILTPKLESKLRKAATEAVTKKHDSKSARKKVVIDNAPIDKVYAILMASKGGSEEFKAITDKMAKEIEPYKSMNDEHFISGAQVLEDDLRTRFESVAQVWQEAETDVTGKISETLQKRHDMTQSLIDARKAAQELRMGDKSAAVDLTGMAKNAMGTAHAAKHFETAVGKSSTILTKRTFWDPETKSHLREVSYAGNNPQEVIVEVWNVGRKGGNLIKSSLVKVAETTEKKWKLRNPETDKISFFRRRFDVKTPATVLEKPGWIRNRGNNLSAAVRTELNSLDSSTIESSFRDGSEGGDMAGYAMTTSLGRHHAEAMGYTGKTAKKVSKAPGFFEKLASRMFNNSKRMTKTKTS